jgi:hypothetical protein
MNSCDYCPDVFTFAVKKLLRNCKLQQNIFAEFSSSFNAGSEMIESEEKERERESW